MFEFVNIKYKNILDVPLLKIDKEQITSFIGASGGGKTTLLKMMNKMISPTEGKILYNGADLKDIDSIAHRRRVAMLLQNPVMFEGSIRDNLNAGMVFQGKGLISDNELIKTLRQIKLDKSLDTDAISLSGGEKQRLALGRIMVLNPDVYLLDEPSSALDDETEDLLIKMIVEYVKNNKKTIVMVTHSKIIARKYSDNIIEIAKGKARSVDYEWNN